MPDSWKTTVVALVCLAVGFVMGWVVAPGGEVAEPVADEAVPSRSSAEDAALDEDEVVRRLSQNLQAVGSPDGPRWSEDDAEFYRRRAEERAASRDAAFASFRRDDGDPGVSPSWNPYVPEVMRPGGFEEQVKRAMEECETDLELVGFDCGEPPCMAIFRGHGNGSGALTGEDCPAWNEPFGDVVTSSGDEVECPDGYTERVLMVGSPRTFDWIDDPTPGDRGNGMRRLKDRAQAAKEEWICATD